MKECASSRVSAILGRLLGKWQEQKEFLLQEGGENMAKVPTSEIQEAALILYQLC